jgi:glycosyltransferase 2 family protein
LNRFLLGRIGRFAVAAGLTGYILWRSDPSAVAAAAAGVDWRWIGVAVLLVLVDRALMAYRWVALLCTIESERRPPIGPLLRVFFVSTFVGTFLPASIGGDIVRSYGLARLDVDAGDAVASVLMDRLLGVASILLMAVAGLGLARDLAGNAAIVSGLIAAAAACVVMLLLIFSPKAAALVFRLPFRAIRHTGARLVESIRRYAAHPPQLLAVLAGSLAVQALRVLQAFCLGRSLGIDAPLAAYFAFIPLILLIMLLPITINGLGTSQAAFVWFFSRAGVSSAAAFALSVLFVALGIVGNLPGAVLYAAGSRETDARPTMP